jgi:hypothetical protein
LTIIATALHLRTSNSLWSGGMLSGEITATRSCAFLETHAHAAVPLGFLVGAVFPTSAPAAAAAAPTGTPAAPGGLDFGALSALLGMGTRTQCGLQKARLGPSRLHPLPLPLPSRQTHALLARILSMVGLRAVFLRVWRGCDAPVVCRGHACRVRGPCPCSCPGTSRHPATLRDLRCPAGPNARHGLGQ